MMYCFIPTSTKGIYSHMTTQNSSDAQYQEMRDLDSEVFAAISGEIARQRDTLEMMASENFVPRAVLQALGSALTNKYAVGYPGHRYYGGCEHVDIVVHLACI